MTKSMTEELASPFENGKKLEAREKNLKECALNESESNPVPEEAHGEREETRKDLNKRSSDDGLAEDAINKEREKDASTSTAEELGLVPVRHPKLLPTSPRRYFVNKDGVVFSNGRGEFKTYKPKCRSNGVGYIFVVNKTKLATFRLEEIMVYTFAEHFDPDKHYVFYKDGQRTNCAWDNLVICDNFAKLQELEIARLEKQHTDTRYVVVRNIHDTLTFERYLVSDAGYIYSLATRHHIKWPMKGNSVRYASLYSDAGSDGTRAQHIQLPLPLVVIQSFKGRLTEHRWVNHINGDKNDNSLKNLTTTTTPVTQEKRSKAGMQANVYTPPVTDQTQWKNIGVLQWNGLSYSQYEVSDMGHVRDKDSLELLRLSRITDGYLYAYMRHDTQAPKSRIYPLRVSRLVANAFVDGYSERQKMVKHLNGNLLDNRAQNLKWIPNDMKHARSFRNLTSSPVDDSKAQNQDSDLGICIRELFGVN